MRVFFFSIFSKHFFRRVKNLQNTYSLRDSLFFYNEKKLEPLFSRAWLKSFSKKNFVGSRIYKTHILPGTVYFLHWNFFKFFFTMTKILVQKRYPDQIFFRVQFWITCVLNQTFWHLELCNFAFKLRMWIKIELHIIV